MISGTIESKFNLAGKIKSVEKIVGRISGEGVLVGRVSIVSGYDDYKGEYNVTPKVTIQTLNTRNKRLANDVVVKEIPFYETDNLFGGQTVNIGG